MAPNASRGGPLAGFRVLEFAGIGPAPLAAMILADLGATVLRLDRPEPSGLGLDRPAPFNLANRSRQSAIVDLKKPAGVATALALVEKADALIEGFRPGTMERLGLGPDVCLARNPRLAYGRITGWGQQGPLAKAAGHDLNYLALTGALDAIGREGAPPTPPLNLVADYGGGAMFLALGLVCAMLETTRSGMGQVVDAAMVDGVGTLMTPLFGLRASGMHEGPRGTNHLDSGAPFYDVYECADGKYVSVAPIETKFREVLFRSLGIGLEWVERGDDAKRWPELRSLLAERFRTKTRDEWTALLEGTDACFAPVLSTAEAAAHPHNRARSAFVEVGGIVQPAPAPRFSRSPAPRPTPPEAPGQSTETALREWGLDREHHLPCEVKE
jgi:alpha-methylacyl-CoA racemase